MPHNKARNAPPEPRKLAPYAAAPLDLSAGPSARLRQHIQARPPARPRHDSPGIDEPYDAAVVVRERRRGTLTTVSSGAVVVLALVVVALAA